MLATAVFVLITHWNEFVFVQLLNPRDDVRVLYAIIGYGQIEWGRSGRHRWLFCCGGYLYVLGAQSPAARRDIWRSEKMRIVIVNCKFDYSICNCNLQFEMGQGWLKFESITSPRFGISSLCTSSI